MCRRAFAGPILLVLAVLCGGCSQEPPQPLTKARSPQPSILLVTLDTTRADSMGFESDAVETPALDALAARGMRFSLAWTTVPMTLPAHASIMTGLYAAEHGVRENSRFLDDDRTLLAERLRDAGYTTAAFVSGYPLKRRFGLARGFGHYDDDMGKGNAERAAGPTTERALSYLESSAKGPAFIWVHYFDPHDPYTPPEPFRSRYASSPYLGEIAYMDQELGRLIEAFEGIHGDSKILVVGDHGEGLGDHGELLHGNLLYSGVMRVPLILAGEGIPTGEVETAVSTRRVFDTILAWAGLDSDFDLLSSADEEIVMGEALKPYLQYGWQPQVMAVRGNIKVIQAGETEVYDLQSDPSESEDLSDSVEIDPDIVAAIQGYALVPTIDGEIPSGSLDEEAKQQLAVLGYVGWESPAPVREDAPSPRDMTHLFDDLDEGSQLFVREEYEASIAVFERVRAEDPENLMVTVRLAVSHSLLGHEVRANELFSRAEEIHPGSIDQQHYLAMHYFRFQHWDLAAPLFEKVLTVMPRKLPALEALARIRESENRFDDAAQLIERIVRLKESPAADWIRLGELEMAMTDTPAAIRAFEEARSLQGGVFDHYLELGVCYLAVHSYAAAAEALDLVPQSHPGYAMALFKRAQASVLLGEPDWRERVRFAYERADPAVRHLIENEPLFQGTVAR